MPTLMQKLGISLTLLALTTGLALTAAAETPTFDRYPVESVYTGPSAKVNLWSHPKARMFRTRLREGNQQPVNFAGHYKLVQIGCGTSCQISFIIDAKNGNVYGGPDTALGADFKKDSKLIIANPDVPDGFYIDNLETEYYLWDNNKLVKLPLKPAAKPAKTSQN